MDNQNFLQTLSLEMVAFDRGDARRIQHFFKVYAFASLIAAQEGLDPQTRFITETAALVHDIGIRPSEKKYGSCGGKLQEQEGPPVCREMLTRLGFKEPVIDRVCYLVGHHHTYDNIDGLDYQILVEADFLVNLQESNADPDRIRAALQNIFRTPCGARLCREMFGL